MPKVTFADIAERNRVRMETLGIPVTRYTLEVSLLQVMSSVGELATLSCNTALDLSKFEREEVDSLIGRLTVSLATLGELFEVSAEEAALRYLDEEERTATRFAAPSRAVTEATRAAAAAAAAAATADLAPAESPTDEGTMTAPLTVDGFYDKVAQLASLPRDVFDAQDVRWVIPTESGELKELVPGGAERRVTVEDYPLFMHILQLHRDARQSVTPEPSRPSNGGMAVSQHAGALGGLQPSAARHESGSRSQEPEVRTKVVGYSADRDAGLFSPSHFSGGLFSPMANAADIGATADVRPPSLPAAVDFPTAYVPPQQLGPQPTALRGVDRLGANGNGCARTVSPISQFLFFDYVQKLRSGSLQPQQISRLHLTFAVPDKDNLLVPLLNGGESITVTAANVGEFLRLVDRTPVALAAEPPLTTQSTQPPSAQHRTAPGQNVLRRTSSLHKLEVQNRLANDRQDFSPTHFSHGLFAPSKPVSEVYVDYDEGELMLPPYLRNAAAARRRDDQQRAQSTPSTLAPDEGNSKSAYVNACRRGDVVSVHSMINEVRKNPQAATIYGLTYAVPSAMEANASAAQRRDGLYGLYPNSQEVPVDANNVGVFLNLVRQYFPPVA